MAKINLAPDVRLEKLKIKRRNFIVTMSAIVILGTMIIFILILQGYRLSRVYSLDQTKKKIASTQDELKSYKDIEDMVINIEQGTRAINEIENGEPKWSKFSPVLEQVTPNDIRFIGLKQDGYKFTGQVQGKQIYSIARLIKSLEGYQYNKQEGVEEKKLFKNIDVKEYSIKDNLVEFEITFEIEQGVLW